MHEYEFRLVVQSSSSFIPLLKSLGYPSQTKVIFYTKPHFRFKNDKWEIKRIKSIHAVYHDQLWFKWVHSIEKSYQKWDDTTCKLFLHNVGNYQNPFQIETRELIQIDDQTQIYTFQSGDNCYKLVFEWEYGTFKNSVTSFDGVLKSLNKYKQIYDIFKNYQFPPYHVDENVFRKPVKCISQIVDKKDYLYAHKLDGIFGIVYSYQDKIKEKWEGYECVLRLNATLGNGIVFAAEKMEDGQIILLDVYQVWGYETASWCRKAILLEYLPQLKLIEGYHVQTYVSDRNLLTLPHPFKTDGIIMHNVKRDVIFKFKTQHSIDLVYYKGYFHLPKNGRIKCLENGLKDGCVYEISTKNGRVIRQRPDRFKGNSAAQLESIFIHGWNGPQIKYPK